VLGHRRVDPSVIEDRRWFNATLNLSAWAGREVRLRFRVLPDPGALAPTGAIANPTLVSARHADERPNLLIVSLDTLRARSVGAYGYQRDTTPFLDDFAERGTLFETAITTSVTTGPSHMSLFTGLYPVNHGMRSGKERKHDDVPTLASQLAAAGYHTAAFTENGFIVRRFGFGQGFSEYTENRATKRESPGEVRVTFPQAERWIDNRAREPFFVFVHTYEVHAPYWPPQPYSKLYEGDGLDGPESELMRKARDNYDREIRYLDDVLRSLIEGLSAQGKLERTLVVVLSDHGEEFSEHGYYQHGGTVFEETLRIPLVFVGPGVEPGRRIETQVSLIDVVPTVLDLLGVPGASESDGVSLAAALRGGPEPEARTLFAEANAPKRWIRPFNGEDWRPPLVAVRRQDEKFIVHRPRDGGPADPTRRYDLAADALERSPRPIGPETLAAVDALVDDYLRGREPRAESPAEPLDPGLQERLHALGYLDAPTEAREPEPTGDAP
jgi:arylsulfatase A-like enzyme